MDLRAELLKSIWYAFTALDVEKSGKVSKSQLKVSPRSSGARMEGGQRAEEPARGCFASPRVSTRNCWILRSIRSFCSFLVKFLGSVASPFKKRGGGNSCSDVFSR